MATIVGTLTKGVKFGKETYWDFELRDLGSDDILACKEAAEKVVGFEVRGKVVPVIVESPARMGTLMMLRQIVRIGKFRGPFDLDTLPLIHPVDMAIIAAHLDLLDGTASADEVSRAITEAAQDASPEVTQRGRDDRPGAAAGDAGSGVAAAGSDTPES
jgi:phage FluMu protein gp41